MIAGRIAVLGTPRELKAAHGVASIHALFLNLMEQA
jgi:hypothetical protein